MRRTARSALRSSLGMSLTALAAWDTDGARDCRDVRAGLCPSTDKRSGIRVSWRSCLVMTNPEVRRDL